MEIIKKLIFIFECPNCGNLIRAAKTFVFDEELKEIKVPKVSICACGNRKKFKPSEIELDNLTYASPPEKILSGIISVYKSNTLLVKEKIRELEMGKGSSTPICEIRNLVKEIGDKEFDEAILALKNKGEIFEPREGYVQIIE